MRGKRVLILDDVISTGESLSAVNELLKGFDVEIVGQAAILAAYHSGGRESSQVAVDYTEVRSLKKPAGAKPGKVIYHTYNTMWVTPDRELCERLKKK